MTNEPIETQPGNATEGAPPPLAIIAAYVGTILVLVLITMIFTTAYSHMRSPRLALLAAPMLAISFAPSFIAAMMTRRSPLPVTISAAAIAMILQPGMVLMRAHGLVGAAIIGALVWLAATRLPLRSTDERRPVGQGMPLRVWMPALAICLGLLPFLARRLTNDPFVPAGMATAMIVLPIAWLLLTAWISAIVPDRIGAYVGRDALRRSMLGEEGE